MSSVRVVIFDAQLDRMFVRRGMVYNHERRRARRVETIAKSLVNDRTRRLRWSIRVIESTDRRKRETGFWVGSDLDYAKYVHDGTTGPIRANGPWKLSVPAYRETIPGTAPRVRRTSVRGQRAQMFLVRAMNRATPG